VVAVYSAGDGGDNKRVLLERVRYTEYGEPMCYAAADVNLDGRVDASDESAWLALLQMGGMNPVTQEPDRRMDLNGDSDVTQADFDLWDVAYRQARQKPTGNPAAPWMDDAPFNGVAEGGVLTVPTRSGTHSGGTWVMHGVDNRFGFAGYMWDPFLKLYHVRHRVYDPMSGRWLQRDPIGMAGGWNLYQYCGGEPWGFVDPLGLEDISVGEVIVQLPGAAASTVGGFITTGWDYTGGAALRGIGNVLHWAFVSAEPDAESRQFDKARDADARTGGAFSGGPTTGGEAAALDAARQIHDAQFRVVDAGGQAASQAVLDSYGTNTVVLVATAGFGAGKELRAASKEVGAPSAGTAAACGSKGAAVSSEQALKSRASEIHSRLHSVAQDRRTTAILEVTDGTKIVGGGARDLEAKQIAILQPGEVAAKLAGEHAEVTVIQHAIRSGQSPRQLVASRPFCAECVKAIEAAGGQIVGPSTAVWPR